jgi:apolipoprotein D and lipocalin family protein
MKKILMIMFGLVAFNINAQAADVTDVTAINDFKPAEYLGEWYEIARIPFYFEEQCKAPVKAGYAQSGDDISVTNSCMTDSGKTDVSNGMAYFVESQNVAKLKVTFVPSWLRFTHIGRGDYWVLSPARRRGAGCPRKPSPRESTAAARDQPRALPTTNTRFRRWASPKY